MVAVVEAVSAEAMAHHLRTWAVEDAVVEVTAHRHSHPVEEDTVVDIGVVAAVAVVTTLTERLHLRPLDIDITGF